MSDTGRMISCLLLPDKFFLKSFLKRLKSFVIGCLVGWVFCLFGVVFFLLVCFVCVCAGIFFWARGAFMIFLQSCFGTNSLIFIICIIPYSIQNTLPYFTVCFPLKKTQPLTPSQDILSKPVNFAGFSTAVH